MENIQLYCQSKNKFGTIHFDNFMDTQNVEDGYNHCKKQISSLKKSKQFYIGATYDYQERFLEHMEDKEMYNMYVLTQAKTKFKSQNIEKKLIKKFCKNINNKKYINRVEFDENNEILNGGGGEGIIHDYNYIYILFK